MRLPLFSELARRLKPLRRRVHAASLNALGFREHAVVRLAKSVPGMFKSDEIRLLYRTTKEVRGPGHLAEIGSWKGRTTVVQALGLLDGGSTDALIYAIDHHKGSEEHQDRIAREGSTFDEFKRNVLRHAVADLIRPLVMDSEEAAALLRARDMRLRMLFIDGAHDEESVRRDIREFLPLVTPGGVIALHDCEPDGGFPGVWRAYQSELAACVEEVDRASSLLVTRLRSPHPTTGPRVR